MYKYDTHVHTMPVSRCAHTTIEDTVNFYKQIGYDGIIITNHFLDGNSRANELPTYAEQIEYYFNDYEVALEIGNRIGLKVFFGVELSYKGTDFLIYGLDKQWFLNNEKIMYMTKREELEYMSSQGALVVHAHPFREADYIDHIRLYPRSVEAVEVVNANRTPAENEMAEIYTNFYHLLKTAGSDNHLGSKQQKLAGMASDTPINSIYDFIQMIRQGSLTIFSENLV